MRDAEPLGASGHAPVAHGDEPARDLLRFLERLHAALADPLEVVRPEAGGAGPERPGGVAAVRLEQPIDLRLVLDKPGES